MNDYLVDRETLSKFVDELIKKKALPVDSVDELNSLREKAISDLDNKLGMAIFGSLTESQGQELEKILDGEEDSEDIFKAFFERNGLDLQKIVADSMQEFAEEFLGGKNE